MRPLVTALQGRLVEAYLGFQKIEEIIKCYTEIRNAIDAWFQRMYQKALSLSELVGGSEERPRVCSRQRNRKKLPSRVSCTVLEMNGGNTIPWRNLLRTQKSLQQGKEGTLWALCSYSSSNHVYVWGDHSRTCAITAWEVGPSDAIVVFFRKWTVSMDEPLEATGSIGLWIHLTLHAVSETRRQHLFSTR